MFRICKSVYILFLFYTVVTFTGIGYPQDTLFQGIRDGFDSVIRGIQHLGTWADEMIRTRLYGTPMVSEHAVSKKLSTQVTVSKDVILSVRSEFGKVVIKTWNEPIIKVETIVTVNAESRELAEKGLEEYELKVEQNNEYVFVSNKLPETKVSLIDIQHSFNIPATAKINCENFFADVIVQNVNNDVAVYSQYGLVELENITGKTTVRTQGEFLLKGRRILGGGSYYFSRTKAELSDLEGEFNIYNFMGEVHLSEIEKGKFAITSENGLARIDLESYKNVQIRASLIQSSWNSNLPVALKEVGACCIVELLNPTSTIQLDIDSAYSEVIVNEKQNNIETPQEIAKEAKPYSEIKEWNQEVGADSVLIVNNQVGDIRIIGTETQPPLIQLKATKLVWISTADKATTTLEQINVNCHRTENRVYITSSGKFNFAIDGLSKWKVNLEILCPPSVDISVESGEGQTIVENIQSTVKAVQNSGYLFLNKCGASYSVSNQKGNIRIESMDGNGEVMGRNGIITAKDINAPLTVHALQSRLNLENIKGKLIGKITEGDVRFLALEGIHNDIDITVEKGNINMLAGSYLDCKFKLISEQGAIDSVFPVTGTFSRKRKEAEATVGEGKYEVKLIAINGNVFIEGIIQPSLSVQSGGVFEETVDDSNVANLSNQSH